MRRLGAVLLVLGVLGLPASATASRGEITSAMPLFGSAAHLIEITASARCDWEGCGPRSLELLAGPKMARIVRRPRIGHCKVFKHYVECPIVHPAVARYTSCRPKLPFLSELWNTESVGEWENKVAEYGLRSEAREPPIETVWQSTEGFPEGTAQFSAQIHLRYGWTTPCLYLVQHSHGGSPAEGCLPSFKEKIREELCEEETYGEKEEIAERIVSGAKLSLVRP